MFDNENKLRELSNRDATPRMTNFKKNL